MLSETTDLGNDGQQSEPAGSVVKFLRQKDYKWVQELGKGACGRTILLYDELTDEKIVCKKYTPHNEGAREELYQNFVREIKLLNKLLHPNVVRVFTSHLYPDHHAGFILMEYIEGHTISEYVSNEPDQINQALQINACLG